VSGQHALSSRERGYGAEHRKRRAALLRALTDGDPCAECHQPMYHSQQLHADHVVATSLGGTRADRLLHAACNIRRGNGLHNDTTKHKENEFHNNEWQ